MRSDETQQGQKSTQVFQWAQTGARPPLRPAKRASRHEPREHTAQKHRWRNREFARCQPQAMA